MTERLEMGSRTRFLSCRDSQVTVILLLGAIAQRRHSDKQRATQEPQGPQEPARARIVSPSVPAKSPTGLCLIGSVG